MIAPMTLASADRAFFLDVRDFVARRHFPIASDDASAGESGETEKPNETHDAFSPFRVRRFPSVLQPFVSVPLPSGLAIMQNTYRAVRGMS